MLGHRADLSSLLRRYQLTLLCDIEWEIGSSYTLYDVRDLRVC